MVGLPPGWESDYDGKRWFYTYKASGHIQYHFPSEGDEFPDYLDASAPAPDLAPEERLESQQQLRRQTTTSAASAAAKQLSPPSPHRAGNGNAKPGMSATARPVSAIWEGDGGGDDDAEQVFQPENFMFLGPGTYNEVSPLNEEEEEAARRVVAGGIGERVAGDGTAAGGSAAGTKAVSPVASTATTPMLQKSEASASPPVPAAGQQIVVESPPIEAEPVSMPPQEEQPVVHMIDSREMPQELPVPPHVFDPVGVVAEMPTEHTAVAHIELHPDPVEMGDSSVLAPIETAMTAPALGMAELPERSSPVELKLPQKTEKTEEVATAAVATEQKPDNAQHSSQHGVASPMSGVNGHPVSQAPPPGAQSTNELVVTGVETSQVHQQSPYIVVQEQQPQVQVQQQQQQPQQHQQQSQQQQPSHQWSEQQAQVQVQQQQQQPQQQQQQHQHQHGQQYQYQQQQPPIAQQWTQSSVTQQGYQASIPQPGAYAHQPEQALEPQQTQQHPQGQPAAPAPEHAKQPPEQFQPSEQSQVAQPPHQGHQPQQHPQHPQPVQPERQQQQQFQPYQQVQTQLSQPLQQQPQNQNIQPPSQPPQPQSQPQYQPLPSEQSHQAKQAGAQYQAPQQAQHQWQQQWSQQQSQSQPQSQTPQQDLPEQFKITRKPTGGLDPQAYRPYSPGQASADTSAQLASDRRKGSAVALQREASLMLGPKSGAPTVDPSTVPRILSPAQMPPQTSAAEVMHQPASQPTTSTPSQPAGEVKPKQESTQEQSQGLAHFPSVLQPASKRLSTQGMPQPVAPWPAQPPSTSTSQAPQAPQKGHGVLSKFPSILKPARGKAATPGPQQVPPQMQTTQPAQAPVAGGGPVGSGQQPLRPEMPRHTTVPGQLPSQGPAPPGTQVNLPYHGAPGPQSAPQGPWQIQQPMRPASVMPAIGGSYSQPNQWAARYQQVAPGAPGQVASGPSPPGQFVPQQYQQVPGIQSSQPARPQSAIGTHAPPKPAPAATTQGTQGPPQQQTDPTQTTPIQAVRRASTFSPGDVSPIRSRSESQSSGLPVQTPSPIEPFRRDSSNPSLPSLAQSVNGPGFTPSPVTGTPGSASQVTAQAPQGPPRPSKLPLQHAPGSFFPNQGSATTPSQQGQTPAQAGPSNATQRSAIPAPLLSSEYPIGYQVVAATPSKKAPAPAKPIEPPQESDQKQQPQQQQVVPPQPSDQKSTPSTPGHLLGRIEEHDESEAVSEPNATPLGTRPSSIGSSLPHSPSLQRQSLQPSPAQSTVLPQPPAQTQGQGPSAQQGTVPGQPQQQQQQQQPAQVPPQQPHHGQGQGPHTPQQGMMPHSGHYQGMMPPQGQMPMGPGAMAPQGYGVPGQHFSQQPQWVMPQTTQAGPASPQSGNGSSNKDKDKKWTKWFKSSKPSASQKPPQQFVQQHPGQAPSQGHPNQPPPNWAAGQYAPPPGWHPSQGPPPPGFQPGMHPQYGYGPPMGGPMPPGMAPPGQMQFVPQGRHSMSDSASTSTVASVLPPHMQQHPHGQAPVQATPLQNQAPPNTAGPFPAGGGKESHHSKSNSIASLPPQGQANPPMPGQHPGQSSKPSSEHNLMPAPLFTSQGTAIPNPGQAGGSNMGGQQAAQSQPLDDKWSKKPAADYSGGDWGEDDQWQRQ